MKTFAQKLALSFGLLTLLGASALQAQTRADRMPDRMDRAEMTERMQEMRAGMQEMHRRMQQMDQELAQQLRVLEEAQGEARIDAMEDTLRTLVEQRLEIHERRQQLMEGMMDHMDTPRAMDREYGETPDRVRHREPGPRGRAGGRGTRGPAF